MAKKSSTAKSGKNSKKNKKNRSLNSIAELNGMSMEMAHKVWLAGIGAYGLAFETSAKAAKKVSAQSELMFEDLVKRGGKLEKDFQEDLKSSKSVKRMFKRMEVATDQIRKAAAKAQPQPAASKAKAEPTQPVKPAPKPAAKAQSAPKPAAKAKPGPKPAAKAAARVADDLQLIKGVGPALAKRLNEAGISGFKQLAELTATQVADLETKIGGIGRIARDKWQEQARQLMTGK